MIKPGVRDASKILEFRNVCVNYGETAAMKDVSLDLYAGNHLYVVGSNGSGKSTMIKTALGLIKPSSGSVIRHISADSISYVPQTSAVMEDFPADVKEVVMSGRQMANFFRPFNSSEDKYLAMEAMKTFGIEELAGCSMNTLSGGQRQRVFLARAICRRPKLLILDEPTTSLDVQITDRLYEILDELNSKNSTAIMMVSHDIDQIEKDGKYVAQMEAGSLTFFGTSSDWKGMKSD